jgi:hypothetical protein
MIRFLFFVFLSIVFIFEISFKNQSGQIIITNVTSYLFSIVFLCNYSQSVRAQKVLTLFSQLLTSNLFL